MFKRKKDKKFIFDECVSTIGSVDSIEKPVSNNVFKIALIFLLLSFTIVAFRLIQLNIVKGAFYIDRSESNVTREVKTPSPRGLIIDRYGVPLVENIPTFSVVINVADLFLNNDQKPYIIKTISNILNLNEVAIEEKLEAINLERNSELLIAKNINLEDALFIKSQKLPSIFIVDDYRRHYLYPGTFSHILGYTAEVTKDDLKQNAKLDLGDDIGKAGLELYYDEYLRGKKGTLIDFKDVRGETIENHKIEKGESGHTLKLTIDAELQQFFYDRMSLALNNLDRTSGVGLAINPQTGEILAALSFPSFDNNAFTNDDRSNERLPLLTDPQRPLFNRFVSGLYNPGSTIKPLVALAALTEKVVTTKDIFFSKGYIEVPNPYDANNPSRFVDWRPNGWVDVYSSLAKSSNIYYYYIGGGFEDTVGLGIKRLNLWWQKFLLDVPSGIDLRGEAVGFLPDPEEKEIRSGSPWRVGDTYNVSIGQGDLSITPISLINYISTIANGGKIMSPYLSSSHREPKVLKDISPEIKEFIGDIQKGMLDATTKDYGTAYIMHNLPVQVGAKTGSAQVSNNKKTNAFFVGFAPYKNPAIAILVLVEDAREGSLNTVPIAKEVLYWYATNRLK